MKIALMFLAIVVGTFAPLEAALNGRLGKAIDNPIYAAFISFLIGTTGLFVYLLFSKGQFTDITQARQLHWSVWTAGLLGAIYVASVIILAPKLGVALTFGLVVAGQLGISLILDHFGLLGLPVHTITWQRVAGVLLIISGIMLIRNF